MLKKIIGALLGVVLLVALGLVVKFYMLSPRMRPAPDLKAAQVSVDAVIRGRYLVESVTGCLGCHSEVDEAVSGEPPVDGRLGSGRDFGLLPGFPGHIRAPNLTPRSGHRDRKVDGWRAGARDPRGRVA